MILVLSPHLDDAVLSCGEELASRSLTQAIHVVSVFTGIGHPELPLTDFDRRSGFTSPKAALNERKLEDQRALSVLGVDSFQHLSFRDRQYAGDDHEGLAPAFEQLLKDINPEQLWIPLGIAHPDHEAVTLAALDAIQRTGYPHRVVAYEDLPSRVNWPHLVPKAMDHLARRGWCLILDSDGVVRDPAATELKRVAVSCYRSQLWALDTYAVMAPERYHRVEVSSV